MSFPTKVTVSTVATDSFMDHTTCCTYTAVFSRELSNAIWKNDREVPNFNFFQLYHYFVVGAIRFALEDFNRKNFKNFVELLTCASQLRK